MAKSTTKAQPKAKSKSPRKAAPKPKTAANPKAAPAKSKAAAAKPKPKTAKPKTAAKTAAKPPLANSGAVAAYTMYGFDWLRADVRAFWSGVAARLKDGGMSAVPARLNWQLSEGEQWRAPGLTLAQTCGYPLLKGDTGPVRLVATPTYAAPFCEGATYRSVIVVGAGTEYTSLAQLKGKAAAINKLTSHSGYNAFRRLVADYVVQSMPDVARQKDRAGGARFFAGVVTTGSHLASLKAVAAGKADVAAIDAVSYHLISRHEPKLTGAVRILTATLPAPGLPLITAVERTDADLRLMRSALADTLGDAKIRPHLENLGISGFQFLGRAAYAPILAMEREAEDMGYPVLV